MQDLTYEILGKDVANTFRPGGYFSMIFEKYRYRADQETMAQVIAKAITNNKAAIVEAGTGTGKSFGELIPTAIYSAKTGKKVLIVTHTIALQQQLYLKDVPVVQNVMAKMGLTFSAALLKGKGNFVCIKKLNKTLEKNSTLDKEEIEKFIKYATKDGAVVIGDKERLPYKPDDKFWSKISPSQDEICDGCPFKDACFYRHNKEQAKNADIIISNHSMLISDLMVRKASGFKPNSGLLPDYDILVIDEAHHIEDVASDFLGVKADMRSIRNILKRINYLFEYGPLKNYQSDRKNKVLELSNLMYSEAQKIFNEILETIRKKSKMAIFWEKKLNGELEVFSRLAEYLMFVQVRLPDGDAKSQLGSVINTINKVYEDLSFINRLQDEEEFVYWAHTEKNEKGEYEGVVKATPVEVNQYLREGLFERMPVVLTSATIKFDKDLQFFANRVGKLTPDEYESVFMDSPFDYENQVCFYIPEYALDASKENEEAYDEYAYQEILDLVKRARGRAFILFTSYTSMDQYFNKLAPTIEKMGYLPLSQRQYERNQLVQKFKEHGNAVLFGADSFWEGIDIPGRELSLVIIHKLPFAVPNPVSEARQVAIKRNGGDPFLEGQVFPAIIKYKQGFGRLIRHEGDKGVFCVLDGRILSKKAKYGKYFLKATPNTQKSMIQQEIQPFFE